MKRSHPFFGNAQLLPDGAWTLTYSVGIKDVCLTLPAMSLPLLGAAPTKARQGDSTVLAWLLELLCVVRHFLSGDSFERFLAERGIEFTEAHYTGPYEMPD